MRRAILGVVVGYITNAALVSISEQIYAGLFDPTRYFVVDVVSQIVATVIGGFLCGLIAESAKRAAAISLIMLGLMIGSASLVLTWRSEPHWYGITLLAIYSPCVWIGYALMHLSHRGRGNPMTSDGGSPSIAS